MSLHDLYVRPSQINKCKHSPDVAWNMPISRTTFSEDTFSVSEFSLWGLFFVAQFYEKKRSTNLSEQMFRNEVLASESFLEILLRAAMHVGASIPSLPACSVRPVLKAAPNRVHNASHVANFVLFNEGWSVCLRLKY